MASGLHGPLGVRVLSHVVAEEIHEAELAPRHPQHTVDNRVREQILKEGGVRLT